jgi:tyrosine-protein phosphatase YwqE
MALAGVEVPTCWSVLMAVLASRLLQSLVAHFISVSRAASTRRQQLPEEAARLDEELRDMRLQARRLNNPQTFVEHSKLQRSINQAEKKLSLLLREL